MGASRRHHAHDRFDARADPAHSRQPVVVHLALVAAGCLLALFAAHTGGSGTTAVTASPAQGSPVPAAQPGTPATDRQSVPLLVTKEHPLQPLSYVPADLIPVGRTNMSKEAAQDFNAMVRAAAADGVSVLAISGYRSYAEQADLYGRYLETFGQGRAAELSAEPGHSEHQTGLAVDIGDPSGACPLMECFAYTPAGAWAADNSWRYGFIIRYPAGAHAVTGYSYEPWHLRHVGVDTATEMHRTGASTLEGYLEEKARPTAR